jgi:glycosyltransferase involved in cell wall biosynthesis
MLNHTTTAVVVAASHEEQQVIEILDAMPDFVDRIVVINDCSKDATVTFVSDYIQQKRSTGPGIRIERCKLCATQYNRTEVVLYEMKEANLYRYLPSEVVNEHSETGRIILINNISNGGVGAAIGVYRTPRWAAPPSL